MLLETLDSVRRQYKPHLEGSKSPPEWDLPIPVIHHEARVGIGVLQVCGVYIERSDWIESSLEK
jgi:hypothetical protein